MDALTLQSGNTVSDMGRTRSDDLILGFKRALLSARTTSDVEKWLTKVNSELRDGNLSKLVLADLRKLRQSAYDKKRKLPEKPTEPEPMPSEVSLGNCADLVEDTREAESDRTDPGLRQTPYKTSDLIRAALPLALIGVIVASCSFLFWNQSVSLYESLGFTEPDLSAAGGLLISLSFAAYFGVTRSKIALICCFYSLAYEGFLVVSGTQTNEASLIDKAIIADPTITGLLARISFAKGKYEEANNRFNDPSDKVFKNQWYQSKILQPRLAEYQEATENLDLRKAHLRARSGNSGKIHLKIAYRFGLIVCIMVFAHILAWRGYQLFEAIGDKNLT